MIFHYIIKIYKNKCSSESFKSVNNLLYLSVITITLACLDTISLYEFNVLENIIRNLIRPKQILVEFHPEKSRAFRSKHFDTIKKLKKIGYKLVYFSNGYRECSFYFSS